MVGDKQNLHQHSYHVGWDSDIDINIMYVGLELESTFCILNSSQRRSSDTFVQFPRKKSLNISFCQIKKERGKVQNMSCAKNTIRNGGLPALRYEPLTLLSLFQLSSKKAIYGLTGLYLNFATITIINITTNTEMIML